MNREIKFRAWHCKKIREINFIDFYNETIDLNIDGVATTTALDGVNLMQYTGLKDKNGRDIFEGDVLHEKREKTAPMANNAIERVFTLLDIRNSYTFDPDNCVVVGNIHQHPELLNS